MKTTKTIMFHTHGIKNYINGQYVCTYTGAELRAYSLSGRGGDTTDTFSPHDAGNEVIALAEQIKAERAIMAMETK